MAKYSQHHYNTLAKILGLTYRELREEGLSMLGVRRVERKIIEMLIDDNEHFDSEIFKRKINETLQKGV